MGDPRDDAKNGGRAGWSIFDGAVQLEEPKRHDLVSAYFSPCFTALTLTLGKVGTTSCHDHR
jgi:hypothetical protein